MGTLLVALPCQALDGISSAAKDASHVIGPHLIAIVPMKEIDSRKVFLTGMECDVVLLDLEESALPFLSAYDPATVDVDYPHVTPVGDALIARAYEWVGEGEAHTKAQLFFATGGACGAVRGCNEEGPKAKEDNECPAGRADGSDY